LWRWRVVVCTPYALTNSQLGACVREYLLHGVTASGWGEATGFTELAWVWEQFAQRLNLAPAPGTFNVQLTDDANLSQWRALQAEPGIVIDPPDASFCASRCYPVLVNDRVPGAIILPEVAGYPPDRIEVVSAQSIRSAMQLHDGDPVTLRAMVDP
jgi:CTP-dependent riboflavin kinase